MIIPVRCFSCGKVIGNKWEEYCQLLESGITIECALNKLGMQRICCRRMFMGNVNSIDKIMLYNNDIITNKSSS